jgi:hypothetical protein
LPKPPSTEEAKKPARINEETTEKGATLFRYGLALSSVASLLIIVESVKIILFSPLAYQVQFLADWGGYVDLVFGVLVLVGFLGVAFLHRNKTIKTTSAVMIGLFSILSFVFFGGGFYLGFILGVCGALLTAARE